MDERFLIHRLRSTRLAAIVGVIVIGMLIIYELLVQGTLSWQMLIVISTMAIIKWSTMLYYQKTD
jgi:hypothetical protein